MSARRTSGMESKPAGGELQALGDVVRLLGDRKGFLLPVMLKLGADPVHFGMIMLLNLGIGLCHRPVGAILFVGCAAGDVTIEQVLRRIWPFYAVMFMVLMLVTYGPQISLWLPHRLGL